MTKEEILAMEAGGKLDRLIEQEIMGGSALIERILPYHYSKGISAAWRVVEKMDTLGYWCHIHSFPTRMWSVRFAPPISGEGQSVDCPSVEEAICKAALLAKLAR